MEDKEYLAKERTRRAQKMSFMVSSTLDSINYMNYIILKFDLIMLTMRCLNLKT